MKLLSGMDCIAIYDRHTYPTLVIHESELSDWPGYAGVLRIKIVKDQGNEPVQPKTAVFHITAATGRGRPKVSVEDSKGKKKTLTGTFK